MNGIPLFIARMDFVPCKGIRIPEYRKVLLVESGIQLKESRIQVPLEKIWNPVTGIRNPCTAWDPETKTFLDPFIHEANGFAQE